MRRPGACRNRSIDVVCAPSGKRNKEARATCKPGSVGDGHLSRTRVAARLKHATRTHGGPPYGVPICACSRWGLPSRDVADALVRSYRTVSAFLPLPRMPRRVFAGESSFLWHLSVGSPRPAVSWHLALWSPDFPHTLKAYATVWPARMWYSSRTCFTLVEPHE